MSFTQNFGSKPFVRFRAVLNKDQHAAYKRSAYQVVLFNNWSYAD